LKNKLFCFLKAACHGRLLLFWGFAQFFPKLCFNRAPAAPLELAISLLKRHIRRPNACAIFLAVGDNYSE